MVWPVYDLIKSGVALTPSVTDWSILAAVVFQGMMNLSGEIRGLAPEISPFLLFGNLQAATILVLTWRRSGCSVLSQG